MIYTLALKDSELVEEDSNGSITTENKIIAGKNYKENKLPITGAVIQSKRKKLASEKNLTTILGIDILIDGIIHDCPLRMVPYIKGITIRS